MLTKKPTSLIGQLNYCQQHSQMYRQVKRKVQNQLPSLSTMHILFKKTFNYPHYTLDSVNQQ